MTLADQVKFVGLVPDVDIKIPPHPVLARDEVRYVGDSVAFIVADTLPAAKDAAEALAIDWQPLPHVTGALAALKKDAPQVWLDRPGNLAFEVAVGDAAATKEAFAKAAKVVALTIVNQRLVTNYLDTRGVVVVPDDEARVIS